MIDLWGDKKDDKTDTSAAEAVTGVKTQGARAEEPEKIPEAERGLVLTFQEVLLLLQSVGIRRINGIYIFEEEVSDEEAIRLLNGLYQKGLITAREEDFQMEETVGRMILCMGWPEREYLSEADGEQVYCYERGEDILITRLSAVRERTLILTLRKKDDRTDWSIL